MPHPSLVNQPMLSARSVRQIGAMYDLGEVLRYTPLDLGYLNCNYLVETARGRYFLKHHVKMRRADLEQQHRLLQTLQSTGLSVAAPLADAEGRTFLTVNHRPVSVFRWIEGVHHDRAALSHDECVTVGALLGRTQRALEEVGGVAQQTFMLPPIRSERSLTRALNLLRMIESREPRDAFDALAEEYLEFTIGQIQGATYRAGEDPCITAWQLTHGDFNPRNVLFEPDQTMTIVDWDKARVQPRLLEVLRTMVLWLADEQTGSIDLEAARSMLRGYSRWMRVEPQVVSDVVRYFWWQRLNNLWILTRHYLEADVSADDLAPTTLRWLRWMTANRVAFAEALEDELLKTSPER
jgi:Ser/Thr protein kinase RdoA (MazF antagonist)